jgi:hypothetical protein
MHILAGWKIFKRLPGVRNGHLFVPFYVMIVIDKPMVVVMGFQNSINSLTIECLRCPTSIVTSPFRSFRLVPVPLPLNMNNNGAYVCAFVPDFTEHPKPKRRKTSVINDTLLTNDSQKPPPSSDTAGATNDDVTFFHDFISGGVAGAYPIPLYWIIGSSLMVGASSFVFFVHGVC